jgi:hypothetical protein
MAAPVGHHPPTRKGTIVAKNKNQNRRRDQQDGRQRPQAPEHDRITPAAEEDMMPAMTRAPRRQQKRFGHN